ncbi:protein FAM117A isoform X1 [Ictalurus punctatus]|uniref:Protein FAM117A isoform X1 n=1 Tax=Ictalurus punctatus TaxID=7998 RepID=A0A2D0PRR8_ICTPU|nr:protein FAM117A isoform X1 [Ictalurus punctatus]XP_053470128.1 protein FAM117A [Ictalurus furcatus]
MSSRGGLQPLRATVPFQLHNNSTSTTSTTKTPAQRWREAKPVESKTKSRPPKPTLRRTLSLDTLVGPYLQGQWPKQPESQTVTCVNDKATQTPSSWTEETRGRRGGVGHKRSASWGSAEHLREVAKLRHSLQKRSRHAPPPAGYERLHQPSPTIHTHMPGATQTIPLLPLSRLAPRLRRSVEGLNLELEGVFVSETAEEQHKILDVPDGHRAPVPVQRCSSGSQSDLSPGLLSPSQSPCPIEESGMVVCGPLDPSLSPPLHVIDASSSSPLPNKTYAFQREPPEGCERVRVCEEAFSPCHAQPSCPDPNKVNFTPHGGSAFCPVSILKPLLPSMDLLFRGLSVSPVTGCSGQNPAPCLSTAHPVSGYLSGPLPDSTTSSI